MTSSNSNSGYIWCPYIINPLTPIIVDSGNFAPKLSLKSRYAVVYQPKQFQRKRKINNIYQSVIEK